MSSKMKTITIAALLLISVNASANNLVLCKGMAGSPHRGQIVQFENYCPSGWMRYNQGVAPHIENARKAAENLNKILRERAERRAQERKEQRNER